MLCEKCKTKNAEIYYSENINGKERKYALCHECADKMKKSGELGFSVPSFFSDGFINNDIGGIGSLIGSMLSPAKTVKKGEDTKKCDLCGMTFNDFMSEGKAGCPRCYEIFGDELERTIAGIHGRTKHTGKVPAKYREKKERAEHIEELRRQISEAVSAEDYERAAKLRDEIRDIEEKSED